MTKSHSYSECDFFFMFFSKNKIKGNSPPEIARPLHRQNETTSLFNRFSIPPQLLQIGAGWHKRELTKFET